MQDYKHSNPILKRTIKALQAKSQDNAIENINQMANNASTESESTQSPSQKHTKIHAKQQSSKAWQQSGGFNIATIQVQLNISWAKFDHNNPYGETSLDLYLHAVTCVLGNNALLIETPYPDQNAIASFEDPTLGTITKPILSVALKYTSPANRLS